MGEGKKLARAATAPLQGKIAPPGGKKLSRAPTAPPEYADVATARRRRPFDTISNFRDVAVIVNLSSGYELLKPKLLYRSAMLDDCSKAEGDKLRIEYGINTVIDLRNKEQKYIYNGKFVPAEDDEDGVTTSKFMGVTYTSISLDSSSIGWARMRRLSLSNKFKFGRHIVWGNEDKAVNVLNTTMAPTGLVGMATDSLDHSGARIKAVFRILADADSYPVLVHCHNGKEITGLVMLLVELLLGVPLPDAQEDYEMSDLGLAHLRDDRLERASKRGMGPEWVDCHETWAEEIAEHLVTTYGGVEGYLASIGVDKPMQEKVISLLRGRPSEKLLDTMA